MDDKRCLTCMFWNKTDNTCGNPLSWQYLHDVSEFGICETWEEDHGPTGKGTD